MESRRVRKDFDTILSSVGELGPWHWMVLTLLIPPALLPGMWSVLFVFSGYVVRHRCVVPGCDTDSSHYDEPWLPFSVPSDNDGVSSCQVFQRSNVSSSGQCSADMFTDQVDECDQYIMDDSLFSSTVVSEWDLVCQGDKGQLMVDLGYTCYSIGVFLGVLVPGFLADKFGRKRLLFMTMLVSAVSTLVSAFMPSYTLFLVTRVFSGFGTLGTFMTMCVLAVEITSAKHKSLVGNLVHILWAPGQMLMAMMAYFIRDWRYLHIAVSVPIFVSLLLYPLTPESPRWLLSVDKDEEAKKIIDRIAKIHKKPEPDIYINDQSDNDRVKCEVMVTYSRVSSWQLISRPGIALTTVILSINWLVVDFCYYGLSLHSVNLSGDIFTNFILSAAVEVPAVVLGMVGMDWMGRVLLLTGCQLVGGLACILAGLLQPPYVMPLSLIGKFASSIVFLIVYLYTAEIYPTQVRGKGLALTATMARIGGFIAPYISGIGVKNPSLPFLIFGGSAVVGGVVSIMLPETKGVKLPETVEEVERIVMNRRFCWKLKGNQQESQL